MADQYINMSTSVAKRLVEKTDPATGTVYYAEEVHVEGTSSNSSNAGGAMINDLSPSPSTTYSGSKIESRLSEITALTDEIAGQADIFSNLPDPATSTGKIYSVASSSGVWGVNRKSSGLYKSTGTAWVVLSDFDVIATQITQNATNIEGKEPVIAASTNNKYWRGDKSWQTLDSAAVGLANVDNTSDANKPVSNPQATAISAKANANLDNVANADFLAKATSAGVSGGTGGGSTSLAWADIQGKPTTFAPSTHTHAVADVTGAATSADLLTKVDKVTGKGLSENDYSNADKALVATIASKANTADVVPNTRTVAGKPLSADITLSKGDVGLSNVDNTSDLLKPISTAQATVNATFALNTALTAETSRAKAAEALLAPQATTYTKTETDTRIQNIIGAAPSALDTLAEIAAQLASDETASGSLSTSISLKAPINNPTFTGTVGGITAAMVGAPSGSGSSTGTNTGDQVLPTKTSLGLSNVDNTSDANKPVSDAQALLNSTFLKTSNPLISAPIEPVNIVTTSATGTITLYTSTHGIHFYRTNATTNFTVNITSSATEALNTKLAVGQSVSVTLLNSSGATAFYPNAMQIDGVSVTPKYLGGTAFTSGSANSIDIYSYTIIKTGVSEFTVLANKSKAS